MDRDDLPKLSDADLAAALADWRRWRSRVCHAPVMRLRPERLAQANAFIAAIEAELVLRSPEGRFQRYRQAVTAVRQLEGGATVSLAAYRTARDDLETVLRRVTR